MGAVLLGVCFLAYIVRGFLSLSPCAFLLRRAKGEKPTNGERKLVASSFLILDISHIISSLLVINELRQDNFIR